MNSRIIYFFILAQSFCSFRLEAQHEAATKFFSAVPQLISDYPSPGNPCSDAIEFTVNSNDNNPVTLQAGNIIKDSKGKQKVNISGTGNKPVWYKIVFTSDCQLNFRIYAEKAENIYHYFVYRQDQSSDFCQRLSQKNVIPIRANMLEHKEGIIGTGITDGIKINYKDTTGFYFNRILLHTPFLDGIRGKAGETYFINIYQMGGTDEVHYLVLNACYREINLKTENKNSAQVPEIIEKLPEHVTNPMSAEKDSLDAKARTDAEEKKKAEKKAAEKAKADALAKTKADAAEKAKASTKAKNDAAEKVKADAQAKKEAAEKAKALAAEKKIADAMARQKAAENAKKKPPAKKLNPQLIGSNETDTLNQYVIEGELMFTGDPSVAVVQAEIYLSNSDGSITILKKIYSSEKGLFKIVNLPANHSYIISLNINDQALEKRKDLHLKGKLTLKGEPAEGVTINTVKTAADGSFTLGSNELFSININDLFNRWSIDLTDTKVYEDIINRVGGVALEGLVYRVQIGAYKNEKNFDYSFMKDLGKVDLQALPDSITRFVMGEFSTLKEADAFKQKAFERKINDAFILAYFNGNKKYLEELIEKNMLENKKLTDQEK